MLLTARLYLLLVLITGKVISGKHHKTNTTIQTSPTNTTTTQNEDTKDISTASNGSSLTVLEWTDRDGWNQTSQDNYTFGETVIYLDIYKSLFMEKSDKKLASEEKYLWPLDHDAGRPLVPYRLFMEDPVAMKIIKDAMEEWEKASCIQFKEVTKGNIHEFSTKEYLDISFISFGRLGCQFGFGKVKNQSQFIHLNKNCLKHNEIVSGLGLTLGIGYEIFRRDRDNYITLNGENSFFGRFPQTYKRRMAAPYDYSSVLQPHGLWHSKNGLLTITTPDIRYQGILGRSNGKLSHRDKIVVNELYHCTNIWRMSCGKKKNPCRNDGYVGSDCNCVCRSGTMGENCEHILEEDYYQDKLSPCSTDIKEQTSVETPFYYASFVMEDTWCVWRIMAPEGYKVELKFNYFELNSTNDCLDTFLEIREKGASYGQTYCGDSLVNQEHKSEANELYLYLDVRNNISKGFQADVKFLTPDGVYMSVSSQASVTTLYVNLTLLLIVFMFGVVMVYWDEQIASAISILWS
ncbi:blastula protease 10-like [Palaemon carinicauda]|uniref:blastula protease 10-like n=1 Tax=Palaemon carinicauda TaxID=392227 RepID=UPI0035B68CE1